MPATHVYDVRGMTCSSCAARVEKRLRETPGVETATVNFAANKAFVTGTASLEILEKRLADLGYGLFDPEKGAKDETARDAAKPEFFRMILGWALALPLMLLHMSGFHAPWVHGAELILAAAVIAGPGRGFFTRAARLALHGQANMDTLVALGSGAAFGFSLQLYLSGAPGPYYFEAAGMILAFILTGKYLEARATARAGESLRGLLDLSPKMAVRLLAGGGEETVLVQEIREGDLLLVKPGESVPVDGEIASGVTEIDESIATGEALPVKRSPGERVLAGTVNGAGVIQVRATALGEASFLARMAKLVEEAQGSKPPIRRLADKISGVFVPVVLALALATAAAWYFTGHGVFESILPAVAVVLIACPCALGLATPTAVLAASGLAAREGILVRNGAALEKAARLDVLLLDKTGTVTEGRPKVVEFLNNIGEGREKECFALAAALERGSEHPLARAVVDFAEQNGAPRLEAKDVLAAPSEGISGAIDGKRVHLGTFDYVKRQGVDLKRLLRDPTMHPIASRAYLVVEEKLYGIFYFEDSLRADAKEAVSDLEKLGLHLVLATGDTTQAARYVAGLVGIDEVHADQKPEHKKSLIEKLRAERRSPGMVGDGINDAPALAAADVGFAVGTGADVALQSADVTLVGGDLKRLVRAVRLSRKTLRIIRENLFFAFVYNVLGIPVAAAGYLSPKIAAAAMAASSLCVVGNALRLQRVRLDVPLPGEARGGKKKLPPTMAEVVFEVHGMSCGNCAQKVEKALLAVPGVQSAKVELEKKQVAVRYLQSEATVRLLKNTVGAAGYTAGETIRSEGETLYRGMAHEKLKIS